ncbi:MAG: SPASM domain-containing protein [Acidobacteriia bacterium]|nr:SPASM domain-containing protein [Terriglobia bacterium]
MKNTFDLNKSPLIVVWETTQACDIACLDYGDWVRPDPDLLELSTQEAERMIDEVAEMQPPIFMMTGADPLKRDDIYDLVRYASLRHLRPILALPATPRLNRDAVADLKQAGLSRLVLNLDGSSAELHDLICGVNGSFTRAMDAVQWVGQWDLPYQITTHYSQRNLHDLENLASLLKTMRIPQWNVIFPVPLSAAQLEEMPSAEQFEAAFARLYVLAQKVPFKIKTSEAPHYRRFVIQQRAMARAAGVEQPQFSEGIPGIFPVQEDRGTMFISHTGEVCPSALLPVSAGNVRVQRLMEIYRSSQVFTLLRDARNLTGKCAECEFKQVCGGSRARAYAMNADMFREDPACVYRPLASAGVRNKFPGTLPEESIAIEEP